MPTQLLGTGGRAGNVTLAMMICMYKKGEKAGLPGGECATDAAARKVPYVQSVLECLGNIDTAKPGEEGVVSPPGELE